MPRALALFLGGLVALAMAGAQDLPRPAPVWRLSGPAEAVQNGVPFTIRAQVQLPHGFYQDADSPFLQFEAQGPAITVSRSQSAAGQRQGKPAFTGSFWLERTIVVEGEHPQGPLVLPVQMGWQICQEDGVCLLPVEVSGTVQVEWTGSSGPDFSALWGALMAAFLGGLLLNVMPCVFPVLALKAVSLASSVGWTRRRQRYEALASAAGSFGAVLVLGLLTAVAAWAGQRLDWGFAFQQPAVVWALALVFAALSLQLLGFLRLPFLSLTPSLSVRGPSRAFLGGAFLVVAAAPCTAPLLGPALGFALTRPAIEIPLYFVAIGAGLALPLFLAGLFPFWGRWLPRPGRWLQIAERVAGVALLATVAYLLWIFWMQNGPLRGVMAVAVLILVVLAAAFCHKARVFQNTSIQLVLGAGLLAASLALLALPLPQDSPPLSAGWEEYSEERQAEALAAGHAVFVDGTAAWCATCQVNEWAVLRRPDVEILLKQQEVVLLRADYTRPNPVVARWLASVNRAGLPVYALYRPEKPVILFPELLTEENFVVPLRSLVGEP